MPLTAKCTLTIDAYDIRSLITEYVQRAYGISIDNQDINFCDSDGDEIDVDAATISTELSPKKPFGSEQGR